jgi:hypothetical protein
LVGGGGRSPIHKFNPQLMLTIWNQKSILSLSDRQSLKHRSCHLDFTFM